MVMMDGLKYFLEVKWRWDPISDWGHGQRAVGLTEPGTQEEDQTCGE